MWEVARSVEGAGPVRLLVVPFCSPFRSVCTSHVAHFQLKRRDVGPLRRHLPRPRGSVFVQDPVRAETLLGRRATRTDMRLRLRLPPRDEDRRRVGHAKLHAGPLAPESAGPTTGTCRSEFCAGDACENTDVFENYHNLGRTRLCQCLNGWQRPWQVKTLPPPAN